MSDGEMTHATLSDHVQKSIEEYVGSFGGMTTGFIGLVTYMNNEGQRGWTVIVGDEQSVMASTGMMKVLEKTIDAQLDVLLFGDPEADDGLSG
jgi:hypothetical protein